MIATMAVIAAIAEKKKTFSDLSDHMKPLSSDRSDNNLSDRSDHMETGLNLSQYPSSSTATCTPYRHIEITLLSSDYS